MIVKDVDGRELTCGGLPLSEDVGQGKGCEDKMHGCALGKRYVDQNDTVEVLCIKAGNGSLDHDGEELMTKDTKKLPSTDR